MQYWEEKLYPMFLNSIEGDRYKFRTDEDIKSMCYMLATQAISTFKFPKVSLSYNCTYLDAYGNVVTKDDNWAVQNWYFENDVTDKEISVLVAWMITFWYRDLNSNADDFSEQYTDANIKGFSKANHIDKNWKKYTDARALALRTEHDYSRVNSEGMPALGDINND